MLETRRARALAIAGDKGKCRQDAAAATTAMSRTHHGETVPDWAQYFDEAEFHAQIGCCFLDLGEFDEADTWIAQASDGQGVDKRRDHATYLLRRATVCIASDRALAFNLAREALPLLRETSSARNRVRVAQLRGP